MKIITEKYIGNIKYSEYEEMEVYEIRLFNKILLKRKYVHPLRKFFTKKDWIFLHI